VAVPVELTTSTEVKKYIDYLLEKGMAPHSINCHLSSIRGFYDHLRDLRQKAFGNSSALFPESMVLKKWR